MKENISLIFSTISILVTLILFIRTLITEKKNISIEIKNIAIVPMSAKRFHLNVIITNHSKNPISISSVQAISYINYEKKIRYARNIKLKILHTSNSKTGELKQAIYCDPIPIKLDGFGSCYSIITIDMLGIKVEDFLNETAYVEINTSRGPIKELFYLKNYKRIDATEMLDFPGS